LTYTVDYMTRKITLIASNVRSSHNVGAFFRTADGFSADLVLTGLTPRPKGMHGDDRLPHIQEKAHKQIAKTALGAEKTVNWKYYKSLEEAIFTLKKNAYEIFAIEQDETAHNIAELTKSKSAKLALLVGSEIEGLSTFEISLCDKIFEIPMSGVKESYNVSIAAAISLYVARVK